MTRAEQPRGATLDDALAADSRESAVGALLRFPPLRRLWSAQFTGGIGDVLALLVLVLLGLQAVTVQAGAGSPFLGGGYRGTALVVAAVFGIRLLATFVFGVLLLGPLSALLAPGKGVLDRRWTMFGADVLRALALIVAPLWIDWTPGAALTLVFVTVFVLGGAERVWAVAKDSAAPALLPAVPPGAVRAAPDHQEALRRLWLRTGFLALPSAAAGLVVVTLISNLFGSGIDWFHTHQAALASYVAAGLFAASVSTVYFLHLPDTATPRPRSPLEGLRRPRRSTPADASAGTGGKSAQDSRSAQGTQGSRADRGAEAAEDGKATGLAARVAAVAKRGGAAQRGPAGTGDSAGQATAAKGTGNSAAKGGADRGRTGAIPLLVLSCAAVAGAVSAAVALAALRAMDLGGGPVSFGLLVLALTGGTAAGIRLAPRTLPALSRRRLLALAIAVTGVLILVSGIVSDPTSVLLLMVLAGVSAGVSAHTGHVLLDLETEEARRARTTQHLQAVVRIAIAVCALVGPVLAALIGPHRVEQGAFVFEQGGAAFSLMLVGALLLPVAALVLGRVDDRQGVPLRRDLLEAFGGGDPQQAPAENGFFIALEGGDGAGKSTQIEALAEWIRGKGHEVVVTKEPGATPIGKRLRSILLDVSSAGLSHRAEALLYAADRAEHIDSVVRPALARGAVVLSDRYIDSSVAYQGAGRDLSPTGIARISHWATDGLVPHLTVLLDVDPETARERFTEAPDRLESEPAEFHERVRAGFLTLAAADPARYLVVDASQEPEAVTTVVRHRLDAVLPLSEQERKAHEEARRKAEEEARLRAEQEAARKAEEERQERERKEQMARLRAEEAERKKREAELEKQRQEARRAEEVRERAEAERRRAEEERERRAAEERMRQEEILRQRRLAEEEARLRAEAEERRLEKQRKAEEALLRSEQTRPAGGRDGDRSGGRPGDPDGTEADTAQFPEIADPSAAGSAPYSMTKEAWDTEPARSSSEKTVEQPAPYSMTKEPRAADEPDAERTAVLPQAQDPHAGDPEPRDRHARDPQGRETRGRDSRGRDSRASGRQQEDNTQELPRVDPETGRPVRPRPEWAEETPLDDVPSLADELLGPHEDEDESGRR